MGPNTAPVMHRQSRKSGLDLIPVEPRSFVSLTQSEQQDYLRSLVISQSTLARYRGVKHLRLWQALALHCYLDPDQLQLNLKGRLIELKAIARTAHPEVSALWGYLGYLKRALKDGSEGRLQCIESRENRMFSFVEVSEFREYAVAERWIPIPPIRFEFDPQLPAKPPTPKLIEDLAEGFEIWSKFDPNGQSDPPDLVSHFRGKGYVGYKCQALASLCRPANARKGRPRKNPRLPVRFDLSSFN